MKIKRFFAEDIRQVLRQVRETLGPDAVILSNKSVDGGVELVAAMDYEESAFEQAENHSSVESTPSTVTPIRPQAQEVSEADESPVKETTAPPRVEWSQDPILVEMRREMQSLRRMMENGLSGLSWREMGERDPQAQELYRRLMGLDLSADICSHLVGQAVGSENLDQGWRKALHHLAKDIATTGDRLLEEGGVVALIGPTGVGKTTTIAKLAARFALRNGNRHVALVSTDKYRIGAQEQLNTYARILDVPVRTAATPEELGITLNALADKRLILVDTAGMSQRDVRLSEQLSLLKAGDKQVRCLFALSATTQQSALEQAVAAFGAAAPEACILTKVDEAASLGGALSALIHSKLPLAFITDGQKVPEDVHLARANTLVSRAATLGEKQVGHYSDEYLALTLGEARANAHV
ncbi:flagellar biosynthesis protein FlhF [Solemya velesiana gill symbiont]|uniref:Flagellar biosynthesis protein FlhF n=1 Tax=Solemya velesiana gill symbiont TaxID=1918948 RepID=A0A1T2KWK9_9GAMM|nr:flagellar biosynthesis protein FlhF [Solemya velesiana gill symbiont]OOZ37239.1 flagellar biosynthesis protein FlhF [Solemya velesiana gill symbiont]